MVFIAARATGDPVSMMLPIEATLEEHARARKAWGMDKPLPVQYGIFIGNALKGDLGTSIRARQPVRDMILQRLPNSVSLASVAIAMAMVIALPLGVVAAVRKGTRVDTVAKVAAVLGQSMPGFWLAIMLILIFVIYWRIFPPMGTGGPMHYVLPAFTMGWWISAGIMRLLRSAMLEVLDSEYVKLARIKGVREPWVIWKHALRNALIPVVTFSGIYFAIIIGAAIVTETVFAWPGIGRLAYEALLWRDFPVLQGVVLTMALIVITVNFLVDMLYAYLDPRIRY